MKKLLLFIAIAAAVVIAGCSASEEPASAPLVASIATFNGSANGLSTFSYTEADGSTVELTAAWNAPEELPVGARVLLYYRAEQYGVSAEIALLSVARIPSGKVEVASRSEIPASANVSQARAWRSGEWINFGAVITFSGNLRELSMIVDSATLSDSIALAYVVVLPATDAVASADRQLYASWNADSILKIPELRAINVNLPGSQAVLIRK